MIIGSENVGMNVGIVYNLLGIFQFTLVRSPAPPGETEKANDCRNDTSGFRLIAKLPNRNRLIPGVPPLVTAASSHTYTQNRFFSDSVSLKAFDSQASHEVSRVSAKPNGVGHRAHRSRPRSKLPQDSSAAALYTSHTGKPIALLTCQHAIRTHHPVRLPRQTHAAGFSAFAPAMNLPETTVVNRSSPVPLPFDLGSFYQGDNVAFDSITGALDMDAGLMRSTVSPTSCAENRAPVAGCGAGFECIGVVRRTKEVFELVEASRYACLGDWDAVESGAILPVVQILARWLRSRQSVPEGSGEIG
ncbi:hypothetical protein PENFLA_c033G09088 [Penicillium flavigenum]|uniref:Uncharacterized protein n=1 Tax=Penicillium flavigenum TaxID=254877 RepID=A0A1V6SM50_9EURO|nr:hypothetical protein PENFLA_c033G09088 [Penicillium flavigenum]